MLYKNIEKPFKVILFFRFNQHFFVFFNKNTFLCRVILYFIDNCKL